LSLRVLTLLGWTQELFFLENIVKIITETDFKNKRTGTAVFQFSANWCGPCQVLTPILEGVAKENNVECYKIDISTNPSIAREMGVQSIPAVFFYKDGEVAEKFVGSRNKDQLQEIVAKAYGKLL
jgi:thioredoxin 1|tara:strand:- start:1841 stop:2215 length:375 start_codon:yes stop_codon:yes gene_type:complete